MAGPIVLPIEVTGASALLKTLDAIASATKRGAAASVSASAKMTAADRASEASAKRRASARDAADDRQLASLQRRLNKEVAAEERAARAKTAAAERQAKAQARAEGKARGKLRGAVGKLATGMSYTAGGLALSAAAAGAGVVGAAARGSLDNDEKARRIAISARKPGQAGMDPEVIRDAMESTAIANKGIKSSDVGEGIGEFVSKTGDLDGALRFVDLFAKTASATGNSVGEIASAAADLQNNLKVESVEEMASALQTLMIQGKDGAVEMSDLAKVLSKPIAAASAFGIEKGGEGVAKVGGLMQIARIANPSAEGAAESVASMFSMLNAKAERLGKNGVKARHEDGSARNIEDILVDTISKSGGNDATKKMTELQGIFGEQGMRAINPLVTTYGDAFRGTKGTDDEKRVAAEKAVRDQLDKTMKTYKGASEIMTDASLAQQGASAQLTWAWETISSAIGSSLVPLLVSGAAEFATMIKGSVPAIEEGMDSMVGFIYGAGDALDLFTSALDAAARAAGLKDDDAPRTAKSETRAQLREADKELRAAAADVQQAGGVDKAQPWQLDRLERAKKAKELRKNVHEKNVAVSDDESKNMFDMPKGLTGTDELQWKEREAERKRKRGEVETQIDITNRALDGQGGQAAKDAAPVAAKIIDDEGAKVVAALSKLVTAFGEAAPAIERNKPIKVP